MRARALIAAAALAVSTVAVGPGLVGAASAAPGSDTATAKPARTIDATGRDSGGNLRVIGKVRGKPAYDGKILVLQAKNCQNCRWKDVRKKRTSNVAKAKFKVDVPRNDEKFFRMRTPASKKYRESFSNVLRACSGTAC